MHRNGFSLVELSIVLVILGLLTGGILAGQSLIRASELRKLTTSFERYHAAIMTFRDKYFAYPGDMNNAYRFWSPDARCAANQVVAAGDPTGCNGNGDGLIAHANGEHFKSWMHLSLAGLIEGNYTGNFTGISVYTNDNTPPAAMGTGRFLLYYYSPAARSYTSGNVLNLSTNNIYHAGSHTVEDAWNVDTKLDDGKPGTGAIFAAATNCTAATNQYDTDLATYDLANAKNGCGSLSYRLK